MHIESSGQTSVFPYIYGAILNLDLEGSIVSSESAQPIRTIQSGAAVVNCLFGLTLTSTNANGVCYTNYGTVCGVYVTGTATHAAHSSNSGQYYNAYAYVTGASGSVLTTSVATITNDPETVVEGLSDHGSADYQKGIEALTNAGADSGEALLLPVASDGEKVVFRRTLKKKGDVNDDLILNILDVSTLLDILAGEPVEYDLAIADVTGNGALSIVDVSELLNLLAGV